MSVIIRVNMNSGVIRKDETKAEYQLLGGRSLTSHILWQEVEPTCEPLGKNNIIVIAPTLLAGTPAPNVNRLSIGAKSPLTGGIKESNVGGPASLKLARLGIKAVIIEGKPQDKDLYVLLLKDDIISLYSDKKLAGLGNYATVKRLQEQYGKRVAILSIGQAGEMLLTAASVAGTNMEGTPSRHAGRGGLGAVFGSKGLKAIIIDDSKASNVPLHDSANFKKIAGPYMQNLHTTRKGNQTFGNLILVNMVNKAGGLPTRNFRYGQFEQAAQLSGEYAAAILPERGGRMGHNCSPGCVIKCSNVFHNEQGEYVTSGLEYETVCLMGSNLCVGNMDDVARFDRLCDDIGIDTIETGAAIGVAMEAGLLEFGDTEGIIDLLEQIGKGTVLGRVIGCGAQTTGKVFGVTRVPVVKGQALAAYDPRALKGTGVTYKTTPMGADHTAGNALPGRGGISSTSPENQVKLSTELQILSAVIDTNVCVYCGPTKETMDTVAKLLTYAYGIEVSLELLLNIGRNTIRKELKFNQAAGFTTAHDRLPEFFSSEKLGPDTELVFDVPDATSENIDLDKAFELMFKL